jgi:hypothetical protein
LWLLETSIEEIEMSYTFDGIKAEVEYRRGRLLGVASSARIARRLRRRHWSGPEYGDQEAGDGTEWGGYDLAA